MSKLETLKSKLDNLEQERKELSARIRHTQREILEALDFKTECTGWVVYRKDGVTFYCEDHAMEYAEEKGML